jgi:hypothetical protein
VPSGRISDERRSRPIRGTKWTGIAHPPCLILVVSVPVMVIEEDWHGHPMIDESTHLWILPAVLVAVAFFCGGALAGFRRPSSAALSALAVASIALMVLLLCAVLRSLWVAHEGVPVPVIDLWCYGIIGTVILSLFGSLLGRRWATNSWVVDGQRTLWTRLLRRPSTGAAYGVDLDLVPVGPRPITVGTRPVVPAEGVGEGARAVEGEGVALF